MILAVAALAYIVLFCTHTNTRMRSRAATKPDELSHNGAGVVVWSDGNGYYAWLRSALIDGDWQFENEFLDYNPWGREYYRGLPATEAGRFPNPFSVGPACVWAAPVIICHELIRATGSWPADGYSLPYQLTVGATTLALGLLTLLLTYRIGLHFAGPVASASAAALLGLGSTLVYYTTIEPSMGHGPASAALAAFVWFWLRGFGEANARRWFVLGLLLGVAAVMRWQLAAYGVLLLGEFVWLATRAQAERPPVRRLTLLALTGAAGGLAGVFPQLFAWRVVYGSWLVTPMPLARHWLSPNVWDVLGTTERGFFYWTPITLLAAVGMLLACFSANTRRMPLVLLLFAFCVQVYFLAVVRGPGVFLGAAFGFRTLTESVVVLAPGLAFLLGAQRRSVLLAALTLAGWNLLLIGAYRFWLLPADAGAPPLQLWSAAARYISSRATDAALIAFAPLAVIALLSFPPPLAIRYAADSGRLPRLLRRLYERTQG